MSRNIVKRYATANHETGGMKKGRSLSTRAARRAYKKFARNRARRDAGLES